MDNETATLEPTQESTAVTESSGSIFDDPEPEEQSSVESESTEGVAEGEAEAETQGADDDTNWLPDEQSKVFKDADYARYAKRYGLTEEQASDPQIRRILHDKINSDIEIADRKKLEQQAEQEEEETSEEELEPTPQLKPEEEQAQHIQRINSFVDQITDTQTAKAFVERLAKADTIKDPEQRAVEVTKALTFGMANAFPDMLLGFLGIGQAGGWLEQQIAGYINAKMPGLGEAHLQSSIASTIDAVRSSNPKYSKMPQFGTPEWKSAALKAEELMPAMKYVQFFYPTGHPRERQPMDRLEAVAEKAKLMFDLIGNAPGAVQQAEKAIETGKKVERENIQRKSLAKLGAGQSKGLTAKSTGNDDLFGTPGEVTISHKLIGKQQS